MGPFGILPNLLKSVLEQHRQCSGVPIIVVDIHSHILPEVDDGPKTWDVSLEMCRRAAADGISYMVATPHANERYAYDREKLAGMVARLQHELGDLLKIGLGCDFHLSYENIQDAIAHPKRYVIDNTRYLLVEFSNYGVPQSTSDSFHRLGDAGITPIITHPERNPILRENLQRVVEWAEQGCVVQVTGSALTGFWGERSQRAAMWLLERQAVHVLATDAHDLEKRVPILSTACEAVEQISGDEIAHALVDSNPQAIVDNHPLPYFPRPLATSYRKTSR